MTDEGRRRLVEEALRVAGEMPPEMVEVLLRAIEGVQASDWPAAEERILRTVAHPDYRALVRRFLEAWRSAGAAVGPEGAAMALSTAATGERARRDAQSVELVWTGPDTEAIPIRHTHQALLQLIGAARRRITLVSYAVYRIPHVQQALVQAAARGVSIRLVIEAPEREEGETAYNALIALGREVAERSRVYLWPNEKRGRSESGKLGSLHVKCAVADGKWLFLSSANLTAYAFTVNMELGVLIRGGPQPEQVEKHFDRLIEAGVLVRL